MGKGSKRRKGEDTSKLNNNWDEINWSKPKKKEVKPEIQDIKDDESL